MECIFLSLKQPFWLAKKPTSDQRDWSFLKDLLSNASHIKLYLWSSSTSPSLFTLCQFSWSPSNFNLITSKFPCCYLIFPFQSFLMPLITTVYLLKTSSDWLNCTSLCFKVMLFLFLSTVLTITLQSHDNWTSHFSKRCTFLYFCKIRQLHVEVVIDPNLPRSLYWVAESWGVTPNRSSLPAL